MQNPAAVPNDNDYLSKQNPHPRDTQITFEEGPHLYTIAGHEDKKFTSVTTWVHSHFKKFDAKQVIKMMMRNQKKWNDPVANAKYYGKTPEEIEEMWRVSGTDASTQGTQMHHQIECFYNTPSAASAASTTEFKYFLDFNRDFVSWPPKPEEVGSGLKPYRTEWMIFHEEAQIAGSIDMIYETDTDDTLCIYDWKRCKEITKTNRGGEFATTPIIEHLPDTNFWHYALQLNTYKYILQTKYNKTITDLYLVVLHPESTNKSYQRIKLPDLQTEVNELFQERIRMIMPTT
jgi:hypothetical protein